MGSPKKAWMPGASPGLTIGYTAAVIARSKCDEAIQILLFALDCFAVARNDAALLRQTRGLSRLSRQFQNMHAGIGAVDDVDIAALVGLEIVGLDRDLAAVLAVDL